MCSQQMSMMEVLLAKFSRKDIKDGFAMMLSEDSVWSIYSVSLLLRHGLMYPRLASDLLSS